ncbi:hypothetical protein G7Y79_00014g036990 [Physcia stellaris]|nr:hypothetical protein G7Y79_00014g036990 [Physcia stellaris]
MHSPLGYTAQWSPFRLDALGLLTMLGGPEMSNAIGRLTFNRLTEFLPILGAYTVPSNDFTQPLSGFALYNITDSIVSNSFSGWFSRWLLAQDASQNNSVFTFTVKHQPPRRRRTVWLAMAIGMVVNCITTLVPFLLGDWYGFASAICIDTSIFVRWYLVTQNRQALDRAAVEEDTRRTPALVKTLCFLRDNKVITVHAPRNVVINCFLTTPGPEHHRVYAVIRALGWISFAGFVVTIGQATLIVQLIIVGLTLLATVLTARGTGSEKMRIGDNLEACRTERNSPSGRRIGMYSALELSQDEEDTMVEWNLLPRRKNAKWWTEYSDLKLKTDGEELHKKLKLNRVGEAQKRVCAEKADVQPLPK